MSDLPPDSRSTRAHPHAQPHAHPQPDRIVAPGVDPATAPAGDPAVDPSLPPLDPTHALDDFVARLRQTPPPAAAPDLSDLDALLQRAAAPFVGRQAGMGSGGGAGVGEDAGAGEAYGLGAGLGARTGADGAAGAGSPADDWNPSDSLLGGAPSRGRSPASPPPRGGKLRSGERWRAEDVEDVDVPELRWPEVPPPATVDAAQLDASTAQLSALAARQFADEALAAAQPTPQPDLQALHTAPPAPSPRLLRHWQAGAWIGAARQVLDAHTEISTSAQGPVVQAHAPLRLLALWAPPDPQSPAARRWPQRLALRAVAPEDLHAELLALTPDPAPLWPDPAGDELDWALLAELALHHQAGELRPLQIDGLRRFITAQREASFARLNNAYRPQPSDPARSGTPHAHASGPGLGVITQRAQDGSDARPEAARDARQDA